MKALSRILRRAAHVVTLLAALAALGGIAAPLWTRAADIPAALTEAAIIALPGAALYALAWIVKPAHVPPRAPRRLNLT